MQDDGSFEHRKKLIRRFDHDIKSSLHTAEFVFNDLVKELEELRAYKQRAQEAYIKLENELMDETGSYHEFNEARTVIIGSDEANKND